MLYLIEILHQTTTLACVLVRKQPLYLIEILHQTTTCIRCGLILLSCILLKFYIKPQQSPLTIWTPGGCILLKFYIKPQHNPIRPARLSGCILLKFYIKPQPRPRPKQNGRSCILLKFYIKPQRWASYWLIKCYLRAVCHYKNTIGCSDEASLMHFPYFKERK